jgi:hypothetical protein
LGLKTARKCEKRRSMIGQRYRLVACVKVLVATTHVEIKWLAFPHGFFCHWLIGTGDWSLSKVWGKKVFGDLGGIVHANAAASG